MPHRVAPIPQPHSDVFLNGIIHPDLWLWDSWVLSEDNVLNLYCLALSRQDSEGQPIFPHQRNDFPFHVRCFSSTDCGRIWCDEGCVFTPSNIPDGSDSHNVWSGSVFKHGSRYLFGYTGINHASDTQHFVQSVCLVSGDNPKTFPARAGLTLSSSNQDYEEIVSAGYYLGPHSQLGHNGGEEGGPIQAWRDPYIFEDVCGTLYMFWSAKTGAAHPSIAWAELKPDQDTYRLGPLLSPINLPDVGKMTQAEVPKIYFDTVLQRYFMIISACDRLHEQQDDNEVTKVMRLYWANSLAGPWATIHADESALGGLENLFGASIISSDFTTGHLDIIAPFTEMAPKDLQLSFAPVKRVVIPNLSVLEKT